MVCSRSPSAKFPRPSKERGLIPRKSLTRGNAIETSLSRNSHIRSPRRVTRAPSGMPSRILNPAMLFPARPSCGFCPVILARSAIAPSRARLFATASPTPMFTTIFSSFGIRIGFCISNLSLSAGATSSRYLSFNLAIYILPGFLAHPDLLPRVREPVPHAGRLPGVRVHAHHVRDVYRGLEGEQSLLVVLARPGVARPFVHTAHDDPALGRFDPLDLAALALLLAGDHDDRVPAFYLETHLLQHLRSERDYPRVTLIPELAGDGAEDARPARGAVVVDNDARVLAKPYVRPVVPARLFLRPDHDGLDDLALADPAARRRLLHGRDDHVADPRVPPLGAAENPDGQDASRPRVVGHPQSCFVLDHYSALDMMFPRRHRLRAEIGRVSTILTVSPTRAAFCSSCTMKRLELLTRFLYFGCLTSVSTETTAVFCGLSETTIPTRSLRLPRVGSLCIEPSSWSSAGPLTAPVSRPASTGSPSKVPPSTISSSATPFCVSSLFSLSSVTVRSPAVSGSGRSGAGRCSSGPP